MTLKRTAIFLDPEDHRALFELALEESRKAGRRITMAEMVRQSVKAYLQARHRIGRPKKMKAS